MTTPTEGERGGELPTPDPADWQPATSAPFETYGFGGQLRMLRSFVVGLTNRDRRLKPYRRSMQRVVLALVALMAVIIGIALVV